MIFVLSKTHKQADDWGRKNLLSPREYRFISRYEVLLGMNRHKYVRVGNYYDRADLGDIQDEIRIRDLIDVTDDYMGL